MSIRGKTKHRLVILVVVAAVLATAAAVVYTVRSRQIVAELIRSRDEGLIALKAADFHTALHRIGRYVQRNPKDAAALYAYAQARENVPLQGGAHLLDAAGCYRRVLDLEPEHPDARHKLMGLYLQMGYIPETLALADQLIQRNPSDTDALRAKAITLARSRQFSEALAIARRHNELTALNAEFQLVTLQIMRQAGESDQTLLAYAQTLRTAHPDDPRFELVQAYASMMAGDGTSALASVRKAASGEITDAEVLVRTIGLLDTMGQFGEALSVIERTAGLNPDARATKLLVERWWQSRQWQRIVDHLTRAEGMQHASDSGIAALHATALIELGRRREADAIIAKLLLRGDDAEAAAWSGVIPVTFGPAEPDPRQMLTACNDALSRVPGSPYFRFLLARAYERMGERELALEYWRKASQVAPAWPAPFVERSRLLLNLGRTADAFTAAQEARRRSPDDPEASTALVLAGAQMITAQSTQQVNALLGVLDRIQGIAPRHEQGVTARILLLARAGQQGPATQAISQALAVEPVLSQQALLEIARASESYGLGQEDACYSRCLNAHGLTPDLALAQARSQQRRGHPQEGLGLFLPTPTRPRVGDPLDWKLAEARYLDEIGDSRATLQWIELADANPANASVQWGAEAARCLAGDRGVRDRVLNRLQELIGPQGMAWRIARARWLLGSQPTERQVVDAAGLLSEVTRTIPDELPAHYLLAQCMERLNNPAVAIEQLTIVADADKSQHDAALRLARLLQAKGDAARARTYVDRVLHSGGLPAPMLRQVAGLLAELADPDGAVKVIEALRQANASSPESDLLLARICWQRKEMQKAEAILTPLLQTPDQSVIRFGIDFYLSQDRVADAERVAAGIDKAGINPAIAAAIRGDLYARTGRPDQALQVYLAGTEAAPADPVIWRALVLHHLSRNDIGAALAAADRAGQTVPQDESLAILRKQRSAIQELAGEQMLRSLLVTAFASPDDATPICEAIEIWARARQAAETPAQIAAKLRPLADRNPKLLPMQLALARIYLSGGKTDDAVTIANRATQLFPDAGEPARAAATALSAAGRWAEALPAAERWRKLSPKETADADFLIANVYLGLGQPDKGLQCVQPYMESAWAAPDDHSRWILCWAQAQLRIGKAAQVEPAMQPLISSSARWRELWMRLAGEQGVSAATAEQWLHTVAQHIPEGQLGERIILARAWQQMAGRTGEQHHKDTAQQMIAQLGKEVQATPGLPGTQVQMLAMLCEGQKDREMARALYRQALQIDAHLGISMNNLASLLAEEGGDLAEAEALATEAVKGNPEVAAFRDTLGYISARRGRFGPAVESMNRAVELQPDNCAYRIRLATALLEFGQQEKARQMLTHVETFRPDGMSLPDRDREQLKILRTRLAVAAAH